MSTIDIKSTLENNISNNALALASDIFPGPIQSAINNYLNGVTIPIGSAGSLTVSGSGANLVLNMTPVVFKGSATANQATLEVSGTGQYSDASIDVQFANNNGQVSIDMNATMGQNLAWNIADLWPSLFNNAPFNQVVFSKGALALTTNGSIKFTGTGSLSYASTPLANGALVVLYNSSAPAVQGRRRRKRNAVEGDPVAPGTPDAQDGSGGLGLLIGVVVPSWSPGSIWKPLNDVTFEQSGLLFSSLPETDSATLGDLDCGWTVQGTAGHHVLYNARTLRFSRAAREFSRQQSDTGVVRQSGPEPEDDDHGEVRGAELRAGHTVRV